MRVYAALISVVFVYVVSACSSSGVNRENQYSRIHISYAEVLAIEPIKYRSEAGKSAAIGGLWGLFMNSGRGSDRAISGAVTGAILSGATTAIAEGDRQAYAYTLRQQDGVEFKVNTDNKHLEVGDCVAVEAGRLTNINKAPAEKCRLTSSYIAEQEWNEEPIYEDDECQAARQELLKAETKQQVDRAIRKVQVLCAN